LVLRLWRHRYLVGSLVRRTFQLRYRQSFAGIIWALVPPLAALGAGTLVFGKILGVDTGEDYAVATMAALVPWTFFVNSFNLGVPSVVTSQAMVARLPFPRAALPLSAIGVSGIDLVLSGLLFIVVAQIAGQGLPITALWAPLLLLIEVVLVVGIILLGSALNVFARDVRLAVPLVSHFWFLLTPVLYPLTQDEELRKLLLLNPMTGLVESFREILVVGNTPSMDLLLPTIVGAVLVLLMGLWYFTTTEPRFADVI
jgi:lipopolysaccharide transport system permease protein